MCICSCIQVAICLNLKPCHWSEPWLIKNLLCVFLCFMLNMRAERVCLKCLHSVVIPYYLHFCDPPSMPAMKHESHVMQLTCYNVFLLWSFNLDFLCYSSVQSLITFQTCICVFLTYFSISLPVFPLSPASLFLCVLSLSSYVIFLGTYGPWHYHTHKFLVLFVLLLCVVVFLFWFYCQILLV